MGRDLARACWLRVAAATCAGLAAGLLVGAVVLNQIALRAENGIPPDDAFGALMIGIVLAVASAALVARSALSLSAGGAQLVIVLSLSLGLAAVLGAFLAMGEPAVFNSGYGCLGRTDVWLAVAMRPTPAPCGYLIPPEDNALFYPAAFASFGAAALGVACAILTFAGRTRRST